MLAATCADVAAISERRVDRLLDPARSRGLPAFLTPEPGLNSGLMITQYTAAALVASLRHAATPFAVQSAATSAGQEDHVSMGYEAALRTRRSVGLLRVVLAIEVLSAAQAIEMRHPLRPAAATGAVIATLRKHTPSLAADRILSGDLEAAEAWASNGEWRDALAAAGVALR
jgi:histidine ammonia-lyase